MKILAINPGSTSTKIAVYENDTPVLVTNIRHQLDELARYEKITDQYDYRKQLILDELAKKDIPFDFDAIIGRGGLVKPIAGGVYEVNDALRIDTINAQRTHACNLGSLIAYELAEMLPGCRAFIADPVVVDEMSDVAHISGSPLLPRMAVWHALNQRAVARRFAREHNTRYEDLNLIVCHLGGGVSVGTHKKGKTIDVNNALDGEGPISPERAGTLPTGQLVDLCFSGKYSKEDVKKMIAGNNAGLAAHLKSTDMMQIEQAIEKGDEYAKLIVDAMVYQIAKSVGAAAVPLYGKVDAILLTGGMARSEYVVPRLTDYISFLAPVYVYPGEDELEALASNALAVLNGEIQPHIYQ